MSQASIESQDAYAALQESGKEATQIKRILQHLKDVGPGTGQEVAKATGLTAYAVSKRRGFLLRCGLVQEQLPRRCRVTGMNARPIQITSIGVSVASGAEVPNALEPTRRDLEAAVIQAAMGVAEAWRTVVDPPVGVAKLLTAAWNLANAGNRHRAGKTVEREPWGSPRRVALAVNRVWLRSNGDEVPIPGMSDPHLRGAIAWCIENGQDPDVLEQPLHALAEEQARRSMGD